MPITSATVHSGFPLWAQRRPLPSIHPSSLFINAQASKQRPNPSQFLPAVFVSISYSLFRLNPSHHFLSRTGTHHREPLIWWERQVTWTRAEEVTSGEPLKEDVVSSEAGFPGYRARVPQQPDPPAMETAVRWNISPSRLPPHALARCSSLYGQQPSTPWSTEKHSELTKHIQKCHCIA